MHSTSGAIATVLAFVFGLNAGAGGTAKPVFDMDSILALHYLNAMNGGLPLPGPKGTIFRALSR